MIKRPSISVQLVHIHGPMKGEIQDFTEGVVSIGRHSSCTLRFPADMTAISRKHAEIRREGNQFKVTDLSSNGTFVNGKKVSEAFLKDGDVLEIAAGGPKFSFLTVMTKSVIEDESNGSYQDLPREQPEVIPCPNEKFPEKHRLPEIGAGNDDRPISDEVAVKARVPLIIQYGPTIRSYKELPIVIGKNPKCDFVLSHPAILDQHAQILFSRNQYWIKDLSGQNLVRHNDEPIQLQAALELNDRISLSPEGPVFCFLGQGRIAEVVQSAPEPSPQCKEVSAEGAGSSGGKSMGSFWSKLKSSK